MKLSHSDHERLRSMTTDEWLAITNKELQGVKDTVVTNAIKKFTREAIEQLCVSAVAGQVRRMAREYIGPNFNTQLRQYVQDYRVEVRSRCEGMSAQKILELYNQLPSDADNKNILINLYREKSRSECMELSTPELFLLISTGNSHYPLDILVSLYQSRSHLPGKVTSDDWREQV